MLLSERSQAQKSQMPQGLTCGKKLNSQSREQNGSYQRLALWRREDADQKLACFILTARICSDSGHSMGTVVND